MMRGHGYDARVILGGLKAWTGGGYPLESVPADDLVLLPSFE